MTAETYFCEPGWCFQKATIEIIKLKKKRKGYHLQYWWPRPVHCRSRWMERENRYISSLCLIWIISPFLRDCYPDAQHLESEWELALSASLVLCPELPWNCTHPFLTSTKQTLGLFTLHWHGMHSIFMHIFLIFIPIYAFSSTVCTFGFLSQAKFIRY